jgi:hypothetical protein
MKISLFERLLERYLTLVKKVIMLSLVFWIGAFVFVLLITTVLFLCKSPWYDGWIGSAGLLTLYCYSDCVLPAIVILSVIVVSGKIMKIPKLYLIKAEVVIGVLAIICPVVPVSVIYLCVEFIGR